jgi:acyl-CoA thioester hydrolase
MPRSRRRKLHATRPPSSAKADVVHEKQIEIRWRDLDAFNHVNHIVFLTYLEEVRDEWLGRVLSDPALVWGYVLARVEIDYRRELKLEDDAIIARCSLERLGTKSVTTNEAILTRDGETAAEAKAVLVARDAETGQSRVISDEERAAFERSERGA